MEYWEEHYVPVEGYKDYEVSNLGNVRNVRTRALVKLFDVNGYKYACLGTGYQTGVHRLVAKAFLHETDIYVNHIDENRSNNRVDNLEWCSAQENVEHSLKKLHRAYLNGEIIYIKNLARYSRENNISRHLLHKAVDKAKTMRYDTST